MGGSLIRTIRKDDVKSVEDMARYLIETFSWFDYEEQRREEAVKKVIDTCDHERIKKAYEWFINQSYDYMATGEVIHWAMEYVRGERDFL